ncbi:MAG: hypothetical protein SGBAC_006752 [Bacillariaceae sp.]
MSNHTNGVFDMIHDEKKAKMDPEKWAEINDPRAPPPAARANEDNDRVMVGGMPVRRVQPRSSTPGAYRVGDTESDYGGRTIGGDSDDGSESFLMVVPKAALVNDEQKDGVMKDIEAPSSKIPIVKARSFPADALHSPPTEKKSTHKRKFRCCMILFCLLLVGLLGGVVYFLSKDDISKFLSQEADNDNGNGNGKNGGGNSGRGGNGDGNGDGGNGRGNNNDRKRRLKME